MPLTVPDATFLGASTPLAAQGTDTPIVSFPAGYGRLFVYYYIAGYSNSGIAILRFGTAAGAVDTTTAYSAFSSHWIVAATVQASVSRVSQTGIQIANDSVTTGRRGLANIYNPATAVKNVDIHTVTYGAQNPTTAATAMTTQSVVAGSWFNTTSQIVSVNLNGGTGVNLIAGSFISVYGIPGTG